MNRLLALAGLLLTLTPAAAHPSAVARGALSSVPRLSLGTVSESRTVEGQEPAGAGKDSLPDGITYTVEARWSGRFGRDRRLRVELTVVNESSAPAAVAFRTSARVCGTLHDSKDKGYYRFPEAAAEVMGTETFLPGKKRVFRQEIPVAELRQAPPGVNAVSAWLCGYETVRAWAEFKTPAFPPDE